MADSVRIEGQGVFVLLWDAKEDLVRALIVVNAALHDVPKRSLLLTPGNVVVRALRRLIETRVVIPGETTGGDTQAQAYSGQELWCLFLQQASSERVGPWLNGWRGLLRQPRGTILIIRHADFEAFQRSAPDLASFVGPRIYNASTMLSMVSQATLERIEPRITGPDADILLELPGTMPDENELRRWTAASFSANDE
jgi:hypothetical protein